MWYIVRVESRKAARVAEAVGGLYPCWKRWTKPSGKKKAVESLIPCFPGWVFVDAGEDGKGYGRERGLDGVLGVMKYGRLGVLWLREEDMERVREIAEASDGGASIIASRPRPSVGDHVDVGWGLSGVVIEVHPTYASVDVGGNWPISWHYCQN